MKERTSPAESMKKLQSAIEGLAIAMVALGGLLAMAFAANLPETDDEEGVR